MKIGNLVSNMVPLNGEIGSLDGELELSRGQIESSGAPKEYVISQISKYCATVMKAYPQVGRHEWRFYPTNEIQKLCNLPEEILF